MKIKFKYIKDKIICNDTTVDVVRLMIRLIDNYINNKLSFKNLCLYNPLYGIDGRPNYILAGDAIFYVIKYSSADMDPEKATDTDRFFWEVYSNPGPYQNSSNLIYIKKLKYLGSKALIELSDAYNKYKGFSVLKFIFG